MSTKLEKLLYNDHVAGCGHDSCDITAAYNNGQTLWATHLLLSAGAASDELNALYIKLKPSKRSLDKECATFIKQVPHTKCTHCDSVNWNTEPNEINNCWQCANSYGGNK